jgi:hypothetical protein
LTKIEHLIKAFGTPVVSKVQEKYPGYMTTVDAKVGDERRLTPRADFVKKNTTWRFFGEKKTNKKN